MASINKLFIQGIRSFGPDERDTQVVKFFRPLTLIVGQNGTGKTTIIECLRYATTGEMPPGSKGKAFIHDPKVAREPLVKARVEVQFREISGELIVCERSLKATQETKDIQVNTIETVLSRKDKETGAIDSINSRCTDIGLAMIDYLGVSRAILQNVIFCHQEDSCWPISEGKVLKAKFDDIFASSGYVKALDSIRKLRIEQTSLIKLYNTDIKYLKENKEKAAAMQDTLRRTEAWLMATKDSVKKINQDLKPIENQLKLTNIIENISQLGVSKSTLLVELGKLEQATKIRKLLTYI